MPNYKSVLHFPVEGFGPDIRIKESTKLHVLGEVEFKIFISQYFPSLKVLSLKLIISIFPIFSKCVNIEN